MKLRTLVLVLGTAALAVVPAFADEPETKPDVNIVFNGPFSPVSWGGDYAGLYTATVDGAVQHVICDDYLDNIGSGATWNADVIWASTLNSGNIGQTMFGGAIGLQGYAEVATLVNMIFQGTSSWSMADLSAVIWDITDLGALESNASWNAADTALLTYVKGITAGMTDAQAIAYLQQFGNLKIYVPDSEPPSSHVGYQELWSVPEGGSALLLLLLAGGVCFAAMRIRPSKRIEIA
jgi:hypothetical protein